MPTAPMLMFGRLPSGIQSTEVFALSQEFFLIYADDTVIFASDTAAHWLHCVLHNRFLFDSVVAAFVVT